MQRTDSCASRYEVCLIVGRCLPHTPPGAGGVGLILDWFLTHTPPGRELVGLWGQISDSCASRCEGLVLHIPAGVGGVRLIPDWFLTGSPAGRGFDQFWVGSLTTHQQVQVGFVWFLFTFCLTELKSHLFELYFIGWNHKPMKEGRKLEYLENTSNGKLHKMPQTKARKLKPQGKSKPAL